MLVRWLACWLPLFALTLSSPLDAEPQTERAELARRLRDAHHVVVGTVTGVEPRLQRNRFGDELIVSRVSIHVGEVLRGAAPTTIAVDVEGGTLNGVTLKVSHVPQLIHNERAVFLLRSTEAGRYELSGGGQGVLPVDDDDIVRGSSLRLDEIRQLATAVGQ